ANLVSATTLSRLQVDSQGNLCAVLFESFVEWRMVQGQRPSTGPCCALLGRSLRDEFQWKSFGLSHPEPFQLSLPQWKWMDGAVYISYRFVVATALVTWLVCEIPFEIHHFGEKPKHLWFTYATEWAFFIYTLTSVAFAVFSIYCRINQGQTDHVVGYKPLWFFFEIATNSILTTSGIYWIAFWDRDYAYFFTLTSKLKHSIPAAFAIIDMFINNVPVRILHCVYPLCLGVVYGLFTFVYWLCGGSGLTGNGVIYPVINWNKPAYAVAACVLALLFCIIIQLGLYALYFTRTYLSYLAGGRGVLTFRELCSPANDEDQLVAEGEATLLEDDAQNTAKTYSSLG
uniref:Protein rolling stone n=2 Tax=Mesocestoides corti TaxID=53468 RepID=A0A5K3FH47_MESCO